MTNKKSKKEEQEAVKDVLKSLEEENL